MSTRAELRRAQREASKHPQINTKSGPNRESRRKPHELVHGTEKDLPFKGLTMNAEQVIIKCKYDNFLCMCPAKDAEWNFRKHVLEARGLPVPSEEEREEMAIDYRDTAAFEAAGPEDEILLDFQVPAKDDLPPFRTNIFMQKKDWDLEEATRRGQEQYDNRTEAIRNPPVPEPLTREQQIEAIREQIDAAQKQLDDLTSAPDEEAVSESAVEPE